MKMKDHYIDDIDEPEGPEDYVDREKETDKFLREMDLIFVGASIVGLLVLIWAYCNPL